jgi:hypothetical protein
MVRGNRASVGAGRNVEPTPSQRVWQSAFSHEATSPACIRKCWLLAVALGGTLKWKLVASTSAGPCQSASPPSSSKSANAYGGGGVAPPATLNETTTSPPGAAVAGNGGKSSIPGAYGARTARTVPESSPISIVTDGPSAAVESMSAPGK